MPSVGRNKAWFPEMVEKLRREWKESLSWSDVITLCAAFTSQRKAIRIARDIRPAMMVCRKCGHLMPTVPDRISVRSLLFALDKNGIASTEVREGLARSWRKYQSRHKLDAWGEPKSGRNSSGEGARAGTTCDQRRTLRS
jgi:hypothetical protein